MKIHRILMAISIIVLMSLFIPLWAEIFCIDFDKLTKNYIVNYYKQRKLPYTTISIYSGKHEKDENENDIVQSNRFLGCKFDNSKILLVEYTPIQVGYVKKSIVIYFEKDYYHNLKDIIEAELKRLYAKRTIHKTKKMIEWEIRKNGKKYSIKLYTDMVDDLPDCGTTVVTILDICLIDGK